jgi:hypothetical protein
MELAIEVSTIIHGMLICLWKTMVLQIIIKYMQLDFLELNHLEIILVNRLLQTGVRLSMKSLISIIVAHLDNVMTLDDKIIVNSQRFKFGFR